MDPQQMSSVPPYGHGRGHDFTSSSIGGTARVQLGDQYVVNHVYQDTGRSSQGHLQNAPPGLFNYRPDAQHDYRRHLSNFLSISQTPEDEYHRYSDVKVKDSCKWLFSRPSFEAWRQGEASNVYWLSAGPGAGKSVVASHIIDFLEIQNEPCSYYFFNQDSGEPNLAGCLRSFAYQMALQNLQIREYLLRLSEEGFTLVKGDFRTLWRKVFINGIFRIIGDKAFYWIVDGVDECSDRHELVTKLEEIQEDQPLRVFVTSRPNANPTHYGTSRGVRFTVEAVTEQDSAKDIRLLVEREMRHLTSVTDLTRHDFIDRIVKKADGCFLWAQLVLDALRKARAVSLKDVHQILAKVPTGMNALYTGMLDSLEQTSYHKQRIQAILRWTALSARPLNVGELNAALLLDVGEPHLAENAASICDHLVYVDKNHRVRAIHSTLREYLLRPELKSAFAIDRKGGHSTLARICLEYLLSEEIVCEGLVCLASQYRGQHSQTMPVPHFTSMYVAQAHPMRAF